MIAVWMTQVQLPRRGEDCDLFPPVQAALVD
jgi:hypothetical protein